MKGSDAGVESGTVLSVRDVVPPKMAVVKSDRIGRSVIAGVLTVKGALSPAVRLSPLARVAVRTTPPSALS